MNNVLAVKKALINDYDEFKQIKMAIDGDRQAFANIIKVNKEYLYKTAYMYVKSEEKALEILQETIAKSLNSIHKLKNPNYFKTWITRILINASMDMRKDLFRKEELTEDSAVLEENKISFEVKLDLYKAVDLLRAKYKTVVIMKYFNDMTINEIAEVMNIPQNTVKTYLSRAKVELKSILREGYLDD